MRTRPRLVTRGLAAMVIAACCTLDSGAQVQLPTVLNPLKDIGRIAITPDGRRVLFSGTDINGGSGTWVKDLRTGAVTRFEVSDQLDVSGAAFSPDGQWLVFFSRRDSTLRRVRVSGGSSTKICDMSSAGAMDWGDDNRIVFSQPKRIPDDPLKYARNSSISELWRVHASGGRPELVAAFKEHEGIVDIHVLPGSHAALLTLSDLRNAWIVAQPLDGGAARMLVPSGTHGRYVPSRGILVYRTSQPNRNPVPLAAAPFDPAALRLTGPTTRLAVDVTSTFAIASTGTLTHVTQPIDLVRVFRDGSRRSLGMLPEAASTPRVSPDGNRVAYSSNGLWVADLARLESTARRLTLDTTDNAPVWSPDGRSVAFAREVQKRGTDVSSEDFVSWPRSIHSIAVDGQSREERVALHGDSAAFWSPLTGRIGYERYIPGIGGSLWTTAPGEGKSRQVFRGPVNLNASLSRDGKWLAFEWMRGDGGFGLSNQVYVSPFRSGGQPIAITVSDARKPVWSPAGDELMFGTNGRLLVTRMRTNGLGASPTFSEPVLIYEPTASQDVLRGSFLSVPDYDVMPDGGSVLVTARSSPQIEVVPDVSSRRVP